MTCHLLLSSSTGSTPSHAAIAIRSPTIVVLEGGTRSISEFSLEPGFTPPFHRNRLPVSLETIRPQIGGGLLTPELVLGNTSSSLSNSHCNTVRRMTRILRPSDGWELRI